jgi:hypothetical protein
MKKWPITILIAAGLLLLALAMHFWGASLIWIAVKDKETIDDVKKLLELMIAIGGLAVPVVKWLWGKSKKDSAVVLPGSPLHQLPSPPADFTGREADLHELRKGIEQGGTHISGLQGQGGVGKTALALKLANELVPRYPDAQIFIDLMGVSEKPVTPTEAMGYVIRSFDPKAPLLDNENEIRAAYNSALHEKRVLLLLDNARDAAQVQPLIPPAGCVLLVTSRKHFALPGLQAKALDALPPSEAKTLLLRIAPRISSESDAIAKLCGYLPLALRLAASTIAERPDLPPVEYARRLGDEKQRLKVLSSSSSGESVEASIGLSYGLLDSEMQKLWRTLGVFPDSFQSTAAAALWQIDPERAHDVLGRFMSLSLLEWHSDKGRYRLHDLVRIFTNGRLTPAERLDYESRHLAYYASLLRTAAHANDSSISLDWENIKTGQQRAAAHVTEHRVYAESCIQYAMQGDPIGCLAGFLTVGLHIKWLKDALKAARYLGNDNVLIHVLTTLGMATSFGGTLEHLKTARQYFDEALRIAKKTKDEAAEKYVLKQLQNWETFMAAARQERNQ